MPKTKKSHIFSKKNGEKFADIENMRNFALALRHEQSKIH